MCIQPLPGCHTRAILKVKERVRLHSPTPSVELGALANIIETIYIFFFFLKGNVQLLHITLDKSIRKITQLICSIKAQRDCFNQRTFPSWNPSSTRSIKHKHTRGGNQVTEMLSVLNFVHDKINEAKFVTFLKQEDPLNSRTPAACFNLFV